MLIGRILLIATTLGAVALGHGTASGRAPDVAAMAFTCRSGPSFTVQLQGNRALVVTGSERYSLRRRASSIGIRYGSQSVAFALDEDRAVLVGAAGAIYHGCRRSDGTDHPED
jgi:hypothetical protein